MAQQLFEDGKVVQVDGHELECVSVTYQETDGEKQNFVYSFQLKSEIDAAREAAAQLERELKASEEDVARTMEPAPEQEQLPLPATPTEEVTKPEAPQEETQYVK